MELTYAHTDIGKISGGGGGLAASAPNGYVTVWD